MELNSQDVIGVDHDDDRPAPVADALRAPETLALASLVLGAISLTGFGLMNGSAFVPQLYASTGPDVTRAVIAALVGAGLALLPLGVGVAALRRLPEGSSSRALAGAGILLAAVSVVLRLVVAARVGLEDDVQFMQF